MKAKWNTSSSMSPIVNPITIFEAVGKKCRKKEDNDNDNVNSNDITMHNMEVGSYLINSK